MSYIHIKWFKERHIRPDNELKIDSLVIDGKFLFDYLVCKSWREQRKIFGRDFENLKDREVIFTNNFYVCMDMALRILAHFSQIVSKLKKRFDIQKVYLVVYSLDYPKWRTLWVRSGQFNEILHKCREPRAYHLAAYRLTWLAQFLTEEEVDAYLPYEAFIAKKYPAAFKYGTLNTRIINYSYDRKDKTHAKNTFFYMMQLIQTEITDTEWKYIYHFVLTMIKRSGLALMYKEENAFIQGFGAAELSNYLWWKYNRNSIIISRNIIRNENVYIYNPATRRMYASYVTKVPEIVKNMHNLKRFSPGKSNDYNMNEFFEMCKNEMGEVMLSTDFYNTCNIFKSPHILYVKCARPKSYAEFDKNFTNIPLDKDMCMHQLREFIPKYNEMFGTCIQIFKNEE